MAKNLTVEFQNIPEDFYQEFIEKIKKVALTLKEDAPVNIITGDEDLLKVNCSPVTSYLEDCLLKCFALYHTSELVETNP